MAILTIALSTFNRNKMAIEVIKALVDQSESTVDILVLDNGSATPLQIDLESQLGDLAKHNIRVERLEANVGPAMLRCLELCRTPWMWGLNDKAVIRSNAVRTVLSAIAEHEDCIFMNFTPYNQELGQRSPARAVSVVTSGRRGLLEGILDYGSMVDYMANVFHVPSLTGALGVGYHLAGSGTPHFAIVLQSVGDNKKCFLSADVIVERPPTPAALRWSQLDYMAMYMTPLSVLESNSERALLQKHILAFMPSTKYFVIKFLLMAKTRPELARYHYRIFKYFKLCYDPGIVTTVLLASGSVLMLAPRRSLGILDLVSKRLFNRDLGDAGEDL